MLPHNARGRALLRRLKVYVGPDHPHEAQLRAGSGERARKRALREAAAPLTEAVEEPTVQLPVAAEETGGAVETTAAAAGQADARLEGALSKYKRAELDAEAERLGIEIESGWNKPDVVEAIQAFYESNPVEAE